MWLVNKYKNTRKGLVLPQLEKEVSQSRLVAIKAPVEPKNQKDGISSKFLGTGNHGFFHLKYIQIRNDNYHLFIQTTHHPKPELEICKFDFYNGTKKIYGLVTLAPVENTVCFVCDDNTGALGWKKQEPQLVQKLNNLQELLPLRVLLKSNNLEAAEIEVKLLVEKGLLSSEAKIEQFSYNIYAYDNVLKQYYVKEIQLGYKAIDQLNLKEILPNFVLPFGTLEDDM
jgi:hypothetical protein